MMNNKSLYIKDQTRKRKDLLANALVWAASFVTVGILAFIIGFIFYNGLPAINWHFLTSDYDDQTVYAVVSVEDLKEIRVQSVKHDNNNYYKIIDFGENKKEISGRVKTIGKDKKSYVESEFIVQKGQLIKKLGSTEVKELSLSEFQQALSDQDKQTIRLNLVIPGGGIVPMVVNTLIMIVYSILIAGPIGVFAAIYLVEYAKPGRLVRIIRFGTESLAGIPSIIYGLFGMLFFVTQLQFGYSINAGALTISIILLPVIIRQTEESLKAVPMSYREGSLGLGATKIQTIRKVVLPSAIPGIVVAIILSIGRIVGESAALLLTAGTVAHIPSGLNESGATLTVVAYWIAKESGDIQKACAIGVIIVVLVILINISAKRISGKMVKQ